MVKSKVLVGWFNLELPERVRQHVGEYAGFSTVHIAAIPIRFRR